jgi:hypothetical protein
VGRVGCSPRYPEVQCVAQSAWLEKHSATVLFAFIRSYPIFQRQNEFF